MIAIRRTKTGLGLFATQTIARGKRIIEYHGPLVSNVEIENSSRRYFFQVNTRWSIDGSARHNLARYINHSCKPSAVAFVTRRRRIWIWSRKSIKAGEEISLDYGKQYFDSLIRPIGCGCKECGASD
jgi:SET domain-containing protein